VLAAEDVPEPVKGIGQVHDPAILTGGLGQKLSKGRFQYTNQNLDIRTVAGWYLDRRAENNGNNGLAFSGIGD
jgi:hypothetical protein